MTHSQITIAFSSALALAAVIGCSTPHKNVMEPYSATLVSMTPHKAEVKAPAIVEAPATVNVQPETAATEKAPALENRKVASARAASLGASSGGRSR